ncbi:MAG: tetratricopeptide repeat protein [Candidatus Sifarchaeia archaeon]
MYKHYETSDEVFVDREEHIEWMNEALERCKKKSVVLHLKGIGGIGKSSLLSHWVNTHERTIRLDCEQYSEFYQRLNMLAKGAVLQGIKLQRFDILWQIRQRFVEGVEPVREEGREWAKEVVMLIPFVGTLASIGSAISAVGSKVTPKLRGKYSTVGKWLQETLGKNHIEQLLEILWKDPRRAEFLYLEAFLEDINNRADLGTPLLFLLDHFEYVDDIKAQWKYQRQKINETQLWTIFLSNLTNCVGVLASRRSASGSKLIHVEESELTELDRDSCFEMLELQNVTDQELQEKIVSVSGGNPFVIDAICDMIKTSETSESDIEDLRADTLAEVRLKVWRKMFNEAGGLQNLINRAGIVPYFNERIMSIIAPSLTPDSWDRLKQFSFVVKREDGTFVLHDLAEELVIAELGQRMDSIVDDVSGLLERRYDEVKDIKLKGLSLSVKSLKQPKAVLNEFSEVWENHSWRGKFADGLALCNAIKFRTKEGMAFLKLCKAWFLNFLLRIAEGEHLIREALDEFNRMAEISETERIRYRGLSNQSLAVLLMNTNRDDEATERLKEAIDLLKVVDKDPPENIPLGEINLELVAMLWWYGNHLIGLKSLKQAEKTFLDAIEQWELWKRKTENPQSEWGTRWLTPILNGLGVTYLLLGKLNEAETTCRRALENIQEPFAKYLCYDSLTSILLRLNRPIEALEFAKKIERLIIEFPEEFPIIYDAYRVSSQALHGVGNYSRALAEIENAIRISRDLMEKSPEVNSGNVALARRIQAVILRQTGKLEEAEEAYIEALHLRRELAEKSPMGYENVVAWTLNDRGVMYSRAGRKSKALKDYNEGLELGRRIVEQYPEYLWNINCVSSLLNNLGVLQFENGRIEEARKAFVASLDICSQPSEVSLEMFLRERAFVLNNLGALLTSRGDLSDAEKVLREALCIRKELEKTGIAYHLVRTSSTLNNLGLLHMRREEFSEAFDLLQRASEILDEITSKSSLDCQYDLRCVLCNQYSLLSKTDSDNEKSESVLERLRELGVKKAESEEWILDMIESS